VCFDDLDALVDRLPPTQRERWAQNPDQRAILRAQDRADVWLSLGTGVTMERGRESEWPHDLDEALAGVGEDVRRLRAVLGSHPSLKGLERHELFEELARAYQRIRAVFPTQRRTGRPRAEWRLLTVALLRQTGVSRRDAEELAHTAGLTAGAPPVSPRAARQKVARQKRAARRKRRVGSSEKAPPK
jgi:hypothetical protein